MCSPFGHSLKSNLVGHSWNVTCAHGWQAGGGLYIYGMATLMNTKVYKNQAGGVSLHFELALNFHPAPHWNVTHVLTLGSMAVGSTLRAQQR